MLSSQDARRLVLEAQGLLQSDPWGTGKPGALNALEHLSYVQIDTISVIARAHHHIFWTRVSDYHPRMLHELMAIDRQAFEYWSHAASYLPMRDFRFSLPRKRTYAEGKRHWFRANRKVMSFVLDRIRAEGPLQAKDFEAPTGHKSSGWFDWKPAKIALERLYMAGELMVRERKGFQKVYDLTERVLPAGVDTRFPSGLEMAQHWVENTLRSQGIATEAEMRYLRRGHRREVTRVLQELEESGRIVKFFLENDPKLAHYVEREALERLSSRKKKPSRRITFLSPFDSLVIQRKRLTRIFEFNYQIECYVPEAKRKFGYFCLPILHGDRLIGRMDAKADRARGELRVLRLFLEGASKELDEHSPVLLSALQRFASFNDCSELSIESVRRIKSSI